MAAPGAPGIFVHVAAAVVAAFVLTPLLIPVWMSVSDTAFVTFPPQGFTLRWYTKILNEPEFIRAFQVSLMLAVATAALALAFGIPAAIALVRYSFPGRAAIQAFVLSPLIFPMLVSGIALLRLFTSLGSRNAFLNMLIGHTVVAVPYVVRTVSASLSLVDPRIEEAARTLGAGRLATFWLIVRPQIMSGVIAGSLFAFVTSFDNYPISMWLSDAIYVPLPLTIFILIQRFFDPGIAAICTLMMLLSFLLVLAIEKATGLKRAMSM
jgi:putative spermidine/putrescine transport system permease protein